MSTELATDRPGKAEKEERRDGEEERRDGEEAEPEIVKGRANEEEEEDGEERHQTNGETDPMFAAQPPDAMTIARQNGGQNSNAAADAALLPPHVGPRSLSGDFHAANLAQPPPPPFGPHFEPPLQNASSSSLPPQSVVGTGQMPSSSSSFPLDAAAVATMILDGRGRRRNGRKKNSRWPLRHWLSEHWKNPYPTAAEKTMLAENSGMSIMQVSIWFANARWPLKRKEALMMAWSARNQPKKEEEKEEEMEEEKTEKKKKEEERQTNEETGPTVPVHPLDPPAPFPLDSAALAAIQPPMPPEHARRKNATGEVTAPLKQWLNEHRENPNPTMAEKTMLAETTGMTMTYVSTWFANARYRLRKVKEMSWSPPRNQPNNEEEEDERMENERQGERPSGSSNPLGAAEEANICTLSEQLHEGLCLGDALQIPIDGRQIQAKEEGLHGAPHQHIE